MFSFVLLKETHEWVIKTDTWAAAIHWDCCCLLWRDSSLQQISSPWLAWCGIHNACSTGIGPGESKGSMLMHWCAWLFIAVSSLWGSTGQQKGLQLIHARAPTLSFIRHYTMIPTRETTLVLPKLIPVLHPTNSLWQHLMLYDSHRLSLEKIYKGLTVIICDCPLCFSSSVSIFCLLCHSFIIMQIFCCQGKGDPGRKPAAQVRQKT